MFFQALNSTSDDVANFDAFGPALWGEDVLDVGHEVTKESALTGGGGSAKYGQFILSTGSIGSYSSR